MARTQIDKSLVGSVNSSAIVGVSGATDAPAGRIGEYVSSIVSTVSIPNSVWTDLTSITLTPGDWDITLLVQVTSGTLVAWRDLGVGISITSGNNFGDVVTGHNDLEIHKSSTGWEMDYQALSVPNYRAAVASTTTYYAKAFVIGTSGSGTGYARISARRAH